MSRGGESFRYPTLFQRIEAARDVLAPQTTTSGGKRKGETSSLAIKSPSPIMKAGGNPSVHFLVDPAIAKEVLSRHELVPAKIQNRTRTGSESDSDASSCNDSTHGTSCTDSNIILSAPCNLNSNCNLQKPTKPTTLLQHALTNSNGTEWIRQRYCVSRAFAVDKKLRASCANHAVNKMTQLLNDILDGNGNRNMHGNMHGIDDGHEATLPPPKLCSSLASCTGLGRRFGRNKNRHRKDHRNPASVDVRILAREVAIHTMARMVLGPTIAASREIQEALRGMFYDNLMPRRNEEMSEETMRNVERLDEAVRNVIRDIYISMQNNDIKNNVDDDGQKTEENSPYSEDCLVRRLLKFEKDRTGNHPKPSADNYYLTREEIIGNAHSAMLAGTQTICTTITGALCHLADKPEMQLALKTQQQDDDADGCKRNAISGKAVVMEALRILPPVAGLPRVPMNCDLVSRGGDAVVVGSGKECKRHCSLVPRGETIVIDLLAFAHSQPPCNPCKVPTNSNDAEDDEHNNGNKDDDATRKSDLFPTLTFDPGCKRNHQAYSQEQSHPWGIGKRKCPAGIISVECISRVIDAIAQMDICWNFTEEKKHSVRINKDMGWLKSISYRPSLCFESPIRIDFERR